MKASEVLAKYAAGERNFQRVNLRGQSFKGKDLSGVDFSEADIRSTNFTGANLRETNFIGAKCGLQKRWATVLVILSWLMTGISGYFLFFSGFLLLSIFESDPENKITNLVGLLVIVIFLTVTIRRGIRAETVAFAVVFAVVGIVAQAVARAGTFTGAAVLVPVAVAGAGAAVGVIAVAFAVAAAFVVAVAAAFVVAVAAAFIVAVGVLAEPEVAFAVPVVVAEAGAGAYIVWRAMRGDARDARVLSFAIAFAALGGTCFRGANLTGANFSSARLKSTDMREAVLTRVRWYGAKMLDRVLPGETYLKSTQVRQWLIGNGTDKNFDGQKLQGINLSGAELTDASFIDANLSEANLQDVNLSRAKLVQTQLDKTNFTGATLTGAFIEDWGITIHTKLDDVKCQYVFMRLPTDEDPEPCRKPDNRSEVFEADDFADFIKPIFDTLDLYHNQGVDPRAIAISWKELAEKNPDAQLQFASMEVKGEDNLLLRLKTSPDADLSQLNAEYFKTYNQLKTLAAEEFKKLTAEKDNRIQALETMVNTALKRPGFYAENYNHHGDNKMAGDKISGDKYEQSGNSGIGHMSGGEIQEGAKVAGVINEAEQKNLADAAKDIQQLLEQLSETYPTTTSREKNIVVGEAVDQIENNPTLKAKVINSLKAGGTEAFKEAIDHPLVNILVASIEGWQDAE